MKPISTVASLNVDAAAGVAPESVNVPPIPTRSAAAATVTFTNVAPSYAAGRAVFVDVPSVNVNVPSDKLASEKSTVTLP